MTFMSGVIFVDVSERSSLPIVFFFKYRNEMAFSDCSNYSEFYVRKWSMLLIINTPLATNSECFTAARLEMIIRICRPGWIFSVNRKTGWTVPLASATPKMRDERGMKNKRISFLSQWLCHRGWSVWLRYVLPFSYTGICNIVLFLLDLVTLACCSGIYQSSTVWLSSEKLHPSATRGTEVIHCHVS